jgi:hypothetical protein
MMINRHYLKFAIAGLLILGALLYWANDTFGWLTPEKPIAEPSPLSMALNTCEGIADKSVANMQVVVDFQKLEIAGRRIRVLQNCMNDQGFVENAAWVAFAQPIAQQNAGANHVSVNEAYEQLRRAQMAVFNSQNGEPLYWIAKGKK